MREHTKSFDVVKFGKNRIINLNESIKVEPDFTKFVESLIKGGKKDIFLWVRASPITLPIFERLAPLLNKFNRYDIEKFLDKGSIFVLSKLMICGYPYKKDERKVFEHAPLRIVYE